MTRSKGIGGATYAGGRPGSVDHDAPPELHPPGRFTVEGFYDVQEGDEPSRNRIRRALEGVLAEFGLSLMFRVADRGLRRKHSSHRRTSRLTVLDALSAYRESGAYVDELAHRLFLVDGDAWSVADRKAAAAKVGTWMSNLVADGSVQRIKDERGYSKYRLAKYSDMTHEELLIEAALRRTGQHPQQVEEDAELVRMLERTTAEAKARRAAIADAKKKGRADV